MALLGVCVPMSGIQHLNLFVALFHQTLNAFSHDVYGVDIDNSSSIERPRLIGLIKTERRWAAANGPYNRSDSLSSCREQYYQISNRWRCLFRFAVNINRKRDKRQAESSAHTLISSHLISYPSHRNRSRLRVSMYGRYRQAGQLKASALAFPNIEEMQAAASHSRVRTMMVLMLLTSASPHGTEHKAFFSLQPFSTHREVEKP